MKGAAEVQGSYRGVRADRDGAQAPARGRAGRESQEEGSLACGQAEAPRGCQEEKSGEEGMAPLRFMFLIQCGPHSLATSNLET